MLSTNAFAKSIDNIGGTAYIVGGYVRDIVRNKKPKDTDIVVTGITEDQLLTVCPKASKIGKSFPVYLIPIDNVPCEVALARTERKVGTGYNGFDVQFDPSITIEQDLFRRDTTINSMAINILTESLIDPYCGRQSIYSRKIAATSHHFKDDPVRALRAARQAAQFEYVIDIDTIELMKQCKQELLLEPRERFVEELKKVLKCKKPSIFFRYLKAANILDVTYPQIAALVGQTQPDEHHPEGDAFEHSMIVVDEVSAMTDKVEIRFAALVHDLGKGLTPKEELPKHYGHDKAGLIALKEFNKYMHLPVLWLKCARFVSEHHMRALKLTRPGKIVELLNMLSKSLLEAKDFAYILFADAKEIPWYISDADKLIEIIKTVDGKEAPKDLKGKKIGDWVFQEQIKKFHDYIS